MQVPLGRRRPTSGSSQKSALDEEKSMLGRHAGTFLGPVLSSLLAAAFGAVPQRARAAEPAAPAYTRASGVAGNLSAVGSDTLNNLMTLWAEAYRAIYPSVRVQVEGKGSSTAPPALIEGTAQL